MMYSRIAGTGSYLPEKVLTNADLEKLVDTSDEWIRTRTGIERRHIAAPDEPSSSLAEHAARRALRSAGLTSFRVAESNDEFHDAQMNSGLLKRLASESGGRYYTADTVRTLPEDISYVDAGVTRVEEKDLWDAPALFLLLAALLSSEGAVRKWKGLA